MGYGATTHEADMLAAMESIASGAVTLKVDNIEFDTGALATGAKQDTMISTLSSINGNLSPLSSIASNTGYLSSWDSGYNAVNAYLYGSDLAYNYDGVFSDSSSGYGIADLLYDSSYGSVAYLLNMIYSLLYDVISGSSYFYVYNTN